MFYSNFLNSTYPINGLFRFRAKNEIKSSWISSILFFDYSFRQINISVIRLKPNL